MKPTVTVSLNAVQVQQILSALLNRGDDKNDYQEWIDTVDQFTVLADQFADEQTEPHGWVVVYTDTRDNSSHTLCSIKANKPFHSRKNAEAVANNARSWGFATDIRVERV